MVIDHDFYMRLALHEAWKYQTLTYPNPPVGAVILGKHGKIVSIAAHHEAGKPHAELLAVTEAVRVQGDKQIDHYTTPQQQYDYLCNRYTNAFQGATIYVTLEPCTHHGKTPPCAHLLDALGFSTIVIGTQDPNPKASGGCTLLKRKSNVTVVEDVLKEQCDALLYPFHNWQNNIPFVFFKLAKFQNGTISGKNVSSLESRKLVHRIRTKIDLLVIGGDTVRIDRPRLDARLVQSKQVPDILIYTRNPNTIDRNIPLFHVSGREVFIENSFSRLKNYKNIMIEGGAGMFAKTRSLVDYYLFFTAPHFREGYTIDLNANLKSLHSYNNSSDTIAWFQNMQKDNQ